MLFNAIKNKIEYWLPGQKVLKLKGISPLEWCLLAGSYFNQQLFNTTHLIICSDNDEAEDVYEALKHLDQTYFYPGHGHSLYSGILTSEQALLQRWKILSRLVQPQPIKIVTTVDAVYLLGPDRDFFKKHQLEIKRDDIISPFDLAEKLVKLGYFSTSTVEEPGTFSRRGEVFDIYPISGEPVRLHYFDDLIETIHGIDPDTQRTKQDHPIESFAVLPAPAFLHKDPYLTLHRSKLPQAQPRFKNKFETRKTLLQQAAQGQLFENYAAHTPLFFEKPETIFDFLGEKAFITFINSDTGEKNFETHFEEEQQAFARHQEEIESSSVLPSPEHFYRITKKFGQSKIFHIDRLDVTLDLNENPQETNIHLGFEPLKAFITKEFSLRGLHPENKYDQIKSTLKVIRERTHYDGHLMVVYSTESARQEIDFLLEENKLKQLGERLHLVWGKINEGFYYRNENIVVLTEADLFSVKKKKTKQASSVNTDLFAEQLATLKVNDYVVHRDHGIGIYLGLETIESGGLKNDFLVIQYESGDKIYVPVYKLNLIQKHADATANLKIASLRTKKFSELKARARNSVKQLAFDLLKLQAERKLEGGFSFNPPDHLYKDFELSFPFDETPDQSKAIFEVLEDMQKPQAMDRLVCGDVGFGKTEIAMRAAMKAVLDKKQVVVLVPTTVLALQHYHSFVKRFENFPVVIDFISRFKTAKAKQETIAKVADGKIDIIIGTHAILSEKITYFDLGLLIIDEEHRFGVAHKEKLKVIKSGVDVLTMTATPIPRTLQLSFLGIRDMSLIQTAPPRRQSIKTYIIKEDDHTLKSAIEKEIARGGQVFYVHNRVHDIEEHELYLKKLVPKARISITHGQLNEKELEKRINDFYNHQSDILLSTTIIESGIDIPNANTMIIDRADMFGLAQLHQLRGRIGRSDRKAYAYFIIPENRNLSDVSQKRLQALQTYTEMGSGFSLASSDMEIRGAGDILGAEQSGHIEGIGLELYMDLLQEAVQELKGIQKTSVKQIEIQTPFAAYIPNSYVEDHGLRLKFYKRLSNSEHPDKIENILQELMEGFGVIPRELDSLVSILKSRFYLAPLALKQLKVSGSQIILVFDQEILNNKAQLRDKMLEIFMHKPKLYKINPDTSVTCFFKDAITPGLLLEFAKHIAAQTGVC